MSHSTSFASIHERLELVDVSVALVGIHRVILLCEVDSGETGLGLFGFSGYSEHHHHRRGGLSEIISRRLPRRRYQT